MLTTDTVCTPVIRFVAIGRGGSMQRSVPYLVAVSALLQLALLPDITAETPPSLFRVTDGVSTPPSLDMVSWSLGSISDASRRFIRQLELAARNGTARLLGILRPDEGYQECRTPSGKKGRCRHLRYCLFGEHRTLHALLDYACVIEGRYVGVCCPEGQEENVIGNADGGLPGSEAAGQLPAIDPGLPGSGLGVFSTPTPGSTPPQVRGCGVSTVARVRIVDGQPAEPKEWPWMVALLRDRDRHFCGGVLITDLHVLTAAHCLHRMTAKDIRVRLGEYDFTRSNETRVQNFEVVDIRVHLNFSFETYENDIAILKMNRQTAFNSYIWPVCLPPPGPDFENMTAIVTGWGTVSYGGPTSPVLMEVAVPVWNQGRCTSRYTQPIMDTALCAGAYEGGKDACQGDSGGPLMLQLGSGRWTAVGIVSWGIRCGEPNTPGIYTRVNRYLQWIVENAVF